jgi:hypothetical protein
MKNSLKLKSEKRILNHNAKNNNLIQSMNLNISGTNESNFCIINKFNNICSIKFY